ncbi:MAG: type II toxin-antitoxin system VapC family toxin [Nitrososphaerota archaeon]|jgi:predicted nucleic acid-binding protein|nr:type II toxin-antitoxin system VapC family toxin [Nitrososphaerota archaeon]
MPPVLDTNLLIDTLSGHPSNGMYLKRYASEPAAITVINKYEFVRGILTSNLAESRKKGLLDFIDSLTVYELTSNTAMYCAEVYSKLKEHGSPLGELDTLILGICIENHQDLITSDLGFQPAAGLLDINIEIIRR